MSGYNNLSQETDRPKITQAVDVQRKHLYINLAMLYLYALSWLRNPNGHTVGDGKRGKENVGTDF